MQYLRVHIRLTIIADQAKETRPGSAMRRGATEWNLSPETARMARDSGDFQEVAQVGPTSCGVLVMPPVQDFKETFAMNITKLAQAKSEAIYATVQKKEVVNFYTIVPVCLFV